jgi:hypothetical protein
MVFTRPKFPLAVSNEKHRQLKHDGVLNLVGIRKIGQPSFLAKSLARNFVYPRSIDSVLWPVIDDTSIMSRPFSNMRLVASRRLSCIRRSARNPQRGSFPSSSQFLRYALRARFFASSNAYLSESVRRGNTLRGPTLPIWTALFSRVNSVNGSRIDTARLDNPMTRYRRF